MRFKRFRHLATAILLDEVIFWSQKKDTVGLNDIEIEFLRIISNSNAKVLSFHTLFIPLIYEKIDEMVITLNDKLNFVRLINISARTTHIQSLHLFRNDLGFDYNYDKIGIEEWVLKLYILRKRFSEFVEHCYQEDSESIIKLKLLDIEVSILGEICLFTYKGQSYLSPYNGFLCIYDLISARYNLTLLTLIYNRIRPFETKLLDLKDLHSLFKAGDTDLKLYPEDFYDIIKSFHPIVVSSYLSDYDPFFSEGRYKKLIKTLPKSKLLSKVEKFSKKYNEDILLLIGLRKCWGHPAVDFIQGVNKIRDNGEHYKPDLFQFSTNLKGRMIFFICRTYFKHYLRWPKVIILKTSPLYNLYKSNVTIQLDHFKSYPKEWEDVVLLRLFNPPTDYDILSIIKDSAIGPQRKDWASEYSLIVRREHKYKIDRNDKKTSRSIIKFLKNPEVSVKSILSSIADCTFLNDEDMCAVLICKEREENVKGRGFTKLTENLRLYQTLAELTISNGFLKIIPGQTMTLDEIQSLKQIHNLSTKLTIDPRNEVVSYVFISNDFKAWNLKFQYSTTIDFFTFMDTIHGTTNLFSMTHVYTKRLLIIAKNYFNFPIIEKGLPIPNEWVWYDQSSWFEGMRQKTWTSLTLFWLTTFLEDGNYIFEYIAQGDNQVIKLRLTDELIHEQKRYKRETGAIPQSTINKINTYTATCMKYLEKCFLEVNHELKAEESWVSSTIMEYGRTLYSKGREIPNPYKAYYRIHPDLNDSFPCFESHISSISANCMSGIKHLYDSRIGFFLSCLETLFTINSFIPIEDFSNEQLLLLICIDKSIGGIPFSLFYHYNIRGVEDHLTISISFLIFLFEKFPQYRNLLARYLSYNVKYPPDFYELLIDPYSLNFSFPKSPSIIVRNTIRENLANFTLNPILSRALEIHSQSNLKIFVDNLLTMRPLDPKVAKAFFFLSNYGISELLVSSFSNVRSYAQLLESDIYGDKIRTSLFYNDKMYINELRSKRIVDTTGDKPYDYLSQIWGLSKTFCPTTISEELREMTWGLKFINVTKACPLDQITRILTKDQITASLLQRTLIVRKIKPINIKKPLKRNYFYGSETGVRMIRQQYNLIEKPDLYKSIMTLLGYVNFFSDENMRKLLNDLINEKIDKCSGDIMTIAPIILSKDVNHRVRDLFESRGCFLNNRVELTSFYKIYTTHLIDFGRGRKNFTIHFQHLFSLLLTQLLTLNSNNLIPDDISYFYLGCPTCVIPTYEGMISFPQTIHYDPVKLFQVNENFVFEKIEICENSPEIPIELILTYQTMLKILLWSKQFLVNLSLNKFFGPRVFLLPNHVARIADLKVVNLGILLFNLFTRIFVLFKEYDYDITLSKFSHRFNKVITRILRPIFKSLLMSHKSPELSELFNRFKVFSRRQRKNISKFKDFITLFHRIREGLILGDQKTISELGNFLVIFKIDTPITRTSLSLIKQGYTLFYDEKMISLQSQPLLDLNLYSDLPNVSDDDSSKESENKRELVNVRENIIIDEILNFFMNDRIYKYADCSELNENYFKIYKVISFNTTSFIKYLPIYSNIKQQKYTQILGDGDGGLSYILSCLNKEKIFYHYNNISVVDIVNGYSPPFYTKVNMNLNPENIDHLLKDANDIFKESFRHEFVYMFGDIIIDIDFPLNISPSEHSQLSSNINYLFNLINSSKTGTLILKINKFFDIMIIKNFLNESLRLITHATNPKIQESLIVFPKCKFTGSVTNIDSINDNFSLSIKEMTKICLNSNLHPYCKLCHTYNLPFCPFIDPFKCLQNFLIEIENGSEENNMILDSIISINVYNGVFVKCSYKNRKITSVVDSNFSYKRYKIGLMFSICVDLIAEILKIF